MTVFIDSLVEILDDFDVAVLDQWGVLHNGSTPYPYAVQTVEMLQQRGKPIVIVSNSGKRADLNSERISRIGLPLNPDTMVVTSGEVLWNNLQDGRLTIDGRRPQTFYVICADEGDATQWAAGAVDVRFELDDEADAILVMGIRYNTPSDACDSVLRTALERSLPLVCSNPDKSSPRADGLVTSPGAVAQRYEDMGGIVVWYGKPHAAIYNAVLRAFPDVERSRFLMVGDSLEHDIAGAFSMGFRSVLVQGGIHRDDFDNDTNATLCLNVLCHESNLHPPDFCTQLFR